MRILTLFFSRGVSLKLWVDKGLFEREKLLYEAYLKEGVFHKIYWLTYGVNDQILANELKNANKLHQHIEVVPMPKILNIPKVGSYLYSLLLPFLVKKELKESSIYKTNQTDGSWSAVIAKKLYKKKLLYRTGFTMSQLENKLKRFGVLSRRAIEFFERLAYKNCDASLVSSQHNLHYVQEKYGVEDAQISVNYNFIDREQFYDFGLERKEKVIYVGRLSEEKNIFHLIKALEGLDLPLEIYGSGPLNERLRALVKERGLSVSFMGNIANNELPKLLNRAQYFALVSKHEGMPKALIEGISCGCLCVGTDVTGINEVIQSNTGVLAEDTSIESIRQAFIEIKSLSELDTKQLKENAQRHIDKNFTLKNIVQKERSVLERLLAD
jgi:glycosyltransferase involved in cell wall biosynthesis